MSCSGCALNSHKHCRRVVREARPLSPSWIGSMARRELCPESHRIGPGQTCEPPPAGAKAYVQCDVDDRSFFLGNMYGPARSSTNGAAPVMSSSLIATGQAQTAQHSTVQLQPPVSPKMGLCPLTDVGISAHVDLGRHHQRSMRIDWMSLSVVKKGRGRWRIGA